MKHFLFLQAKQGEASAKIRASFTRCKKIPRRAKSGRFVHMAWAVEQAAAKLRGTDSRAEAQTDQWPGNDKKLSLKSRSRNKRIKSADVPIATLCYTRLDLFWPVAHASKAPWLLS
jgi:hypothetical protein